MAEKVYVVWDLTPAPQYEGVAPETASNIKSKTIKESWEPVSGKKLKGSVFNCKITLVNAETEKTGAETIHELYGSHAGIAGGVKEAELEFKSF